MKSVVFWACFSVAFLMVGAQQQPMICGRVVCQPNQYCYSPYPALNACYNYRNYGESCYQRGLYLCGPGLDCAVVASNPLGTCVFGTTTAANTAATAAATTGEAPVVEGAAGRSTPLLKALLNSS